MKTIGQLLFLSLLITHSQAQNVGIGTTTPQQKLDVNGAIKVGNNGNTAPQEGTLRWNTEKKEFEGFNGSQWISLSGGMNGWGNAQQLVTENDAVHDPLNTVNGKTGKALGTAMAAYGNYVVVGAPYDYNSYIPEYSYPGSARLYHKWNGRWFIRHRANNTAPSGSEGHLGSSVAIDASRFVVGEPGFGVAPGLKGGRVHVYSYNENGAHMDTMLSPAAPQAYSSFGTATGIAGNILAVGTPHWDVGLINPIENAGIVYLYRYDGANWVNGGTVSQPDRAGNDYFGSSICVTDEYLIVGAKEKNIGTVTGAGKAYVYRRSGNTWNLIAELTSPAAAPAKHFGCALAFHNGTLVIGANHAVANQPGKAYIYTVTGNTVTFEQMIEASDAIFETNYFGEAVAIKDNVVLVGAPGADIQSRNSQGKMYAFTKVGAVWKETAIMKVSDGAENDRFGASVVLLEGYCAGAATGADLTNNPDNGQVFFFQRP